MSQVLPPIGGERQGSQAAEELFETVILSIHSRKWLSVITESGAAG
jgi:hypothetical protein